MYRKSEWRPKAFSESLVVPSTQLTRPTSFIWDKSSKGIGEQGLDRGPLCDNENDLLVWIGELMGNRMEGPLKELLKDGTILCDLINKISPEITKKGVITRNSNSSFKHKENISLYLASCLRLGMNEDLLFEADDLLRGQMTKVFQNLAFLQKHGKKLAQRLHKLNASTRMPITHTKSFPVPSVSSLNSDLAFKEDLKHNPELERMARKWIEDVTGEQFPFPSFYDSLKSGVLLCKLLNKIKPKLVPRINESKISFKQMENIDHFIRGCLELGLKRQNIFDTPDLYEAKSLSNVIVTIHVLAKHVKKMPGFGGPYMEAEQYSKTRTAILSIGRMGKGRKKMYWVKKEDMESQDSGHSVDKPDSSNSKENSRSNSPINLPPIKPSSPQFSPIQEVPIAKTTPSQQDSQVSAPRAESPLSVEQEKFIQKVISKKKKSRKKVDFTALKSLQIQEEFDLEKYGDSVEVTEKPTTVAPPKENNLKEQIETSNPSIIQESLVAANDLHQFFQKTEERVPEVTLDQLINSSSQIDLMKLSEPQFEDLSVLDAIAAGNKPTENSNGHLPDIQELQKSLLSFDNLTIPQDFTLPAEEISQDSTQQLESLSHNLAQELDFGSMDGLSLPNTAEDLASQLNFSIPSGTQESFQNFEFEVPADLKIDKMDSTPSRDLPPQLDLPDVADELEASWEALKRGKGSKSRASKSNLADLLKSAEAQPKKKSRVKVPAFMELFAPPPTVEEPSIPEFEASQPVSRSSGPWKPTDALVVDFAIKEDLNRKGMRKSKKKVQMEDQSLAEFPWVNDSKALFAVFDGHGGINCALEAKDCFPEIFEAHLQQENLDTTTDLGDLWERCYLDVDDRLIDFENEGTTATTVFVWKAGGKRFLQAANVGDSTSFLLKKDQVICLSKDHKPTDPDERERLRACGIDIAENQQRVNGLTVCRALGDHFLKKPEFQENSGMTAQPYVSAPIEVDCAGSILIVASDGLWDVMSGDKAMEIAQKYGNDASTIASQLLSTALEHPKCVDNITIIAVVL